MESDRKSYTTEKQMGNHLGFLTKHIVENEFCHYLSSVQIIQNNIAEQFRGVCQPVLAKVLSHKSLVT